MNHVKPERPQIAILGAGPVGLEAAAAAVRRGYPVTVLERGELAQHVLDWGHVRLFTAFGRNAGPEGCRILRESGVSLPREADFLTGCGYREQYLVPLGAALDVLARIETGAKVIAVGRHHLLKGEAIGGSQRARDGFRILVELAGSEREFAADVVLDCSGTFGNPGWAGPGGTPAVGERCLRRAIVYGLPDILGDARSQYAGKSTLLIGDGYSAATSALLLAELCATEPETSLHWITREPLPQPIAPISDDPLPARAELTVRANAMAASPPTHCQWEAGVELIELAREREDEPFTVKLRQNGDVRPEVFDRVIANVGFEPDDSLYRQLQIHECYASRGPMKMAAALLAAGGDGPVDCLSLGGFGPDVLKNPEPNYFILGAKSYGKNSAFLLQTGYEQVQDVFGILEG